jgi:hypothetical protein
VPGRCIVEREIVDLVNDLAQRRLLAHQAGGVRRFVDDPRHVGVVSERDIFLAAAR